MREPSAAWRTWPGSKGSIMPCFCALSRIQRSLFMLIAHSLMTWAPILSLRHGWRASAGRKPLIAENSPIDQGNTVHRAHAQLRRQPPRDLIAQAAHRAGIGQRLLDADRHAVGNAPACHDELVLDVAGAGVQPPHHALDRQDAAGAAQFARSHGELVDAELAVERFIAAEER